MSHNAWSGASGPFAGGAAVVPDLLRRLFRPVREVWDGGRPSGGGRHLVKLLIEGPVLEFSDRRRGLPPFLATLPFFPPPAPPAVSVVRTRALAAEVARDPNVDGILVELRSTEGGAAALTSLREALSRVRAAGKELVF